MNSVIKTPRILNAFKVGLSVPNSVFVGRPSPYGNPFPLTQEKNRTLVIEKFRQWVMAPEQEGLRGRARRELEGKNLICYCSPKKCHAQIWMEIANG